VAYVTGGFQYCSSEPSFGMFERILGLKKGTVDFLPLNFSSQVWANSRAGEGIKTSKQIKYNLQTTKV
jgi:hypothetical protein